MNQELRIMDKKKNIRTIIHDSLFMIRKFCGFTLIELLVVISIIGVLAGFLLANFIGVRQRARDTQRKSDLRAIQSALEFYRSDKGAYPLTGAFPSCTTTPPAFTNGANPPVIYMQKIPCDPLPGNVTGNLYKYTSDGATYMLIACLENGGDTQKDQSNNDPCDGSANFSYTLQNP